MRVQIVVGRLAEGLVVMPDRLGQQRGLRADLVELLENQAGRDQRRYPGRARLVEPQPRDDASAASR